MKDLEIVFTHSIVKFPILSWSIRWYTSVIKNGWKGIFKLDDISHVAREVVRRDWGSGYYQASDGNVNYEHESVFKTKHKIVKSYILKIHPELEMNIRKACWEDCGKKYGIMQNIGIVLVKAGFKKDNPWKDGRNCSELLYVKVFKLLIPELDYNPDTIMPHEIEDIILKYFKEKEGYWYLKQ